MGDYEPLRRIVDDDLFSIWRGVRHPDRFACLLKFPRSDPPRTYQIHALEREGELLERVGGVGLPVVMDHTENDGVPCLVYEDVEGLPLGASVDLRSDLAGFLDVAVRLAELVGCVHEQGVVLRSLTANSIFVDGSTGAPTLVDLGLAVREGDAERTGLPLHEFSQRLAYVAPEQTGRTNHSTDHRSDLYALGVILYEMLLGRPPFTSRDALEMLHAHLALQPRSPREVDPGVPVPVSSIIMKLLSKTPDERYWSAAGLGADLRTCLECWTRDTAIEPFELGRSDVPDRLTISRRLYGRSREVERLRSAFEVAAAGASSLVLMSGYSGAGKTTLIQDLYRHVIRHRGVFASGRCNQAVRGRPYGAVLQAFRDLVDKMLVQSEERVAQWRRSLEDSLGTNLSVLAEVLPEICPVVGEQPPATALSPNEAQNRFRSVMLAFVATVARPDQPVVISLDNLQWSDHATLDLLETLATASEVQCLLIIGAYRDNEVDAGHPLLSTLQRLDAAQARLERVVLRLLTLVDVTSLLADTLHLEPGDVAPLARVVLEKTDGNPFFAIQFLETLHEQGLVSFDASKRRWDFQIEAIRYSSLTDNVADLVAGRIRRLPPNTQRLVGLAACIGNVFDVEVLSVAAGCSLEETAASLGPALAEGVLLSPGSNYTISDADEGVGPARFTFVHDRVQQAAYTLVEREDRTRTHATVGRLMREKWGEMPTGERLFVLAHHLHAGRTALVNRDGMRSAACIQLNAARRAKAAAAHRGALDYALAGIEVMQESGWETDPELTWELYLEAAECQYLCGDFESAESYFGLLLERAPRARKADVYCLMTTQYENLSRFEDALHATREGLALFELNLPSTPPERAAALDAEVKRIEEIRGVRPIASLVELPRMEDPSRRSLMRLLMTAWAPTYLSGHADLTRLISAMMVRLSLEHGSTEESAYGYVTHAITVGPIMGDYAAAYEWGRLALAVNDRFDDRRLRARIYQQFQAHVNLWVRPIKTCVPHAREARRAGLESGDHTYAGYGAFTESWPELLYSSNLASFVIGQTPNLELLEKIHMSGLAEIERAILAFAGALQGHTEAPILLSCEDFDEAAYEDRYSEQIFFMAILDVLRLWLALVFDDEDATRERVGHVRQEASAVQGTVWIVISQFLEGLALARLGIDLDRLTEIRARLAALSEYAPENWSGFAQLLGGECSRLEGAPATALRSYEDAIEHALRWGSPGQAALACEVCARCCLQMDNSRLAHRYLRDAKSLYERWGASAKVEQVTREHGRLLAEARADSPRHRVSGTWGAEDAGIDVVTFAKQASAIAGEIVLEELLRKLLRIVIENAGAQRGLFLRENEEGFVPDAEGGLEETEVVFPRTPDGGSFSVAAANYVRKTGRSLVVADATTDDLLASDPYVTESRPRSILSVPIMLQGRSLGQIYLENNLGPDAFTLERVRLIEILSGQIAIALENARLYEDMSQEVERRAVAEEELRVALDDLQTLKNRLQAENAYLREEVHQEFDEIVGDSPPMRDLLASVERVAPTDATVLVLGETGTGKELVARAIHRLSARRDHPLTRINCGAMPAGLVESELFGHAKGAFTGAVEQRAGRFELADGGTIFLDEVAELAPETQVKLLRVLQEREFEPIGSDRTLRVDVRVIAATNRDLEEAVREGRFRSDLYYRLNVIPIHVPPLRERASDIPKLVTHFVDRACRASGRVVERIPGRLMDRLESYAWPGNIRELQNLMERAVILSPGPELELEPGLLRSPTPHLRQTSAADPDIAQRTSLPTLEESERNLILDALRMTKGVINGSRGAAQLLDIHPNTLRSRMKKLQIARSEIEGHEFDSL